MIQCLDKNHFQICAKQSKDGKKNSAHRILYWFTPNLGLHSILILQDQISLTQLVHKWTINHWISTTCQFPIWTSNLASNRPATPLDFSFASYCWTYNKKKGFLFYCTRYRSSPRKRDSNQELNLTLLSNEYYRFVSTLQKWVNLREKVEAKMQISHLEILLKILLFWNASTSFPCPSKMSYKPPHEDHCSGLHTTNKLLE